jgi:predicted SprT family Zn-dependent metalloprotease
MNREAAIRIGRQKMDENGLQDWKIKTETAYSRAGVCFHYEKEIRLSEQYIARMPDEEITDTILHEIAHALLPAGHGHDDVWRDTCIRIGARPKRCVPEGITVERKWVAICPTCGGRFGRMKKVRRGSTRWCRKCHNKYPNNLSKSILIFEQNIEYKEETR